MNFVRITSMRTQLPGLCICLLAFGICAEETAANPPAANPVAKISQEDSDAKASKDPKAEPKAPDAAQIKKWIEDLGSEEYAARQAAELRLREAGKTAFDILKAALEQSKDPEAQARLSVLVKEIGTLIATEKLLNQDGLVTTKSGLKYKILKEGEGTPPKSVDTVVVHYKGTLLDGTEFDSSFERKEPATFPVFAVIKGWTEALQLMKPGAKWQIIVPPDLAYGENGAPPKIPPKATLVFEIELLKVIPPARGALTPGSDLP